MPRRRAPTLLRRVSTVLLVALLVLLGVLTASRVRSLAEQERQAAASQARAELGTLITLWEDVVSDRIASWLSDLPAGTDAALREGQTRAQVDWFEAFYLWEQTATDPRLVYPPPSEEEGLSELLSSPCMRAAQGHAVMGARERAAEGFLACREGSAAEQLLASNLAARQFQELDRPALALTALTSFSTPLDTPLTRAQSLRVSVQRLTTRRLLAGEVLRSLGREDRARELLLETAREITRLSGNQLEVLLPTAQRLSRVELSGTLGPEERALLDGDLQRAARHLVAFQELQDRLPTLTDKGTSSGPLLPGSSARIQVLPDLYSNSGFLLLWAQRDETAQAAIHVDAQLLLDHLQALDRGDEKTDQRIVVLDSSGMPIRGDALPPEQVVLAQAPLGWMFPHLRLAVVAPPPDPGPPVFWSVLAQLLPLGIAIVLGVVGIVVQQAANRRERELFARQADFMARVTHELKTPLAGIRVMAETLQMGAKHDPKTVDKFLDRIIHESENLGARIDEVLTAARRPEVSEHTPIHPEQLAAEVVETWRPRFQHAGAILETDLRPCHPIPADPPLLRDALGNLLDNALKYRRPGVRGRVLVRTAETSRWVLIEVVDNGLGVPVSMRNQIFERFARVEGPGRGKAGGHGLGLSFVADTAEAHRGMVECADGFDGGARFRIKLRRRRP